MSKDTPTAPAYARPLNLPLSQEDLDEINAYLSQKQPHEILEWALEYLPALHQTTAFGLTGVAATDMISKLKSSRRIPLIFVDTLYHFKETYDLVDEMRRRYDVDLHVYKPEGCDTTTDFERKFGERLWETDETTYDYLVKVSSLTNSVCDLLMNRISSTG
jgi:phosphoadenosine phosphosulfate reductase